MGTRRRVHRTRRASGTGRCNFRQRVDPEVGIQRHRPLSLVLFALTVLGCDNANSEPEAEHPQCELSQIPGFPDDGNLQVLPTGSTMTYETRIADESLIFETDEGAEVLLAGHLLPADLRVPDIGEVFVVTNVELPNRRVTDFSYYRFDSETSGLWVETGSVLPDGVYPDGTRFQLLGLSGEPRCMLGPGYFEDPMLVGVETDTGQVVLGRDQTTSVVIEEKPMVFVVANARRTECDDCSDIVRDFGSAYVYEQEP